ncbi:Common plant regulatory factor 1 [Camellia lanceoleosa]|uniref:Common plant regulatory factor 1 n=1 Tax=Camellia lanceoleosa TaxID=1840588 RepID=A0ACC0G3N3_9ERIC|nr:Common plant regulatory factor 1 [Camellia lanceoleosa]
MISPKSEKSCPKSEKASSPKQIVHERGLLRYFFGGLTLGVQDLKLDHPLALARTGQTFISIPRATIQAYYGPGVPIPPSYLNSAVMACHVPHPHVWAPPQHVMPPYGVPYSAIYSPGVVCTHPTVPIIATPVSAQMLSTSSDNMDQGSTKKLKRLDGVTKQVVNDNAEVDGEGSAHGASQRKTSLSFFNHPSCNFFPAQQSLRKSDSMGKLSTDNKVKVHKQARSVPEEDANVTSRWVSRINVAPENVAGKPVDSPNWKTENRATCVASTTAAGLPCEDWKKLKREKIKHTNKQSARRSRLRKQAETEELMKRYETVKVENITLKSEMKQLMEDSEKLRVENVALMENLNGSEVAHPEKRV